MQLPLEFQTTRKGSLPMMEYILKQKTLADSLAAIREPITDMDQILQLLGCLGADYNAIVASQLLKMRSLFTQFIAFCLRTHE